MFTFVLKCSYLNGYETNQSIKNFVFISIWQTYMRNENKQNINLYNNSDQQEFLVTW